MKKIIIIILISSLLVYGIYLGLQKRFYQTISHETLIGIARCVKSPDKNYNFYLFYFPVIHRSRGRLNVPYSSNFIFAKLQGRDWLFEGEIIKWKRPLNLLGFKTAHRPVRIYDSVGNSCYLDVGARRAVPLLAFKIGEFLPIVDANFTSIAKQSFIQKVKFGVYATNTGYLVRRIK